MADRRRRRLSIRARITVLAALVVSAALTAGAVGVVTALERTLTAQLVDHLETTLTDLAERIDDDEADASTIEDLHDGTLVAYRDDGDVAVNDDGAAVMLAASDGVHELRIDGEPSLALVRHDDDRTLAVARSMEEVTAATAATTGILAVAIPIAVALMAVVVWFVVRRALAPVERIRREVDALGASTISRRVARTGSGDEIDRLAGTMNRMLDRVEDGYRARQRFVADASHELRSPLATIRQFTELHLTHPTAVPAGELAGVMQAEGARMEGIVEGLLLLAGLEEGANRAQRPVDLDDLVRAELSRLTNLPAALTIGIALVPVQVRGDERLLAQLVRNLLDNAARHAAGRIDVATGTTGDWTYVTVDDDGAGIAQADREAVFERFARLDEARARDSGGSGLGLAITRRVAHVHGGDVRIDTAPIGGARFSVFLPPA